MSKQDNLDPYESLANAIIMQAVKDYREALRKLSRGRGNRAAEAVRDECLRFFRSGWFSVLTSVDPEYLIRKLDEEVPE